MIQDPAKHCCSCGYLMYIEWTSSFAAKVALTLKPETPGICRNNEKDPQPPDSFLQCCDADGTSSPCELICTCSCSNVNFIKLSRTPLQATVMSRHLQDVCAQNLCAFHLPPRLSAAKCTRLSACHFLEWRLPTDGQTSWQSQALKKNLHDLVFCKPDQAVQE